MYGVYVDSVVMQVLGISILVCSDFLVMFFLVELDEYEGGELQIEGLFGIQVVKFEVGDMVFYLLSSLYQVMFVIEGVCIVFFFWIQSMVQNDSV